MDVHHSIKHENLWSIIKNHLLCMYSWYKLMKTNYEEVLSSTRSRGLSSSKVFTIYWAAASARNLTGDAPDEVSNDVTSSFEYNFEDSDEENQIMK